MLTSKPGLELFTPGLEFQLHQGDRSIGCFAEVWRGFFDSVTVLFSTRSKPVSILVALETLNNETEGASAPVKHTF